MVGFMLMVIVAVVTPPFILEVVNGWGGLNLVCDTIQSMMIGMCCMLTFACVNDGSRKHVKTVTSIPIAIAAAHWYGQRLVSQLNMFDPAHVFNVHKEISIKWCLWNVGTIIVVLFYSSFYEQTSHLPASVTRSVRARNGSVYVLLSLIHPPPPLSNA